MIKRVLIVDDDLTFLTISKLFFRRYCETIEVVVLSNPKTALNQLSAIDPDIIFLDINMPSVSGWEFLDHKITNQYSGKFIITTSSIDSKDRRRALENGKVKGFISKPLSQKHITKYLAS